MLQFLCTTLDRLSAALRYNAESPLRDKAAEPRLTPDRLYIGIIKESSKAIALSKARQRTSTPTTRYFDFTFVRNIVTTRSLTNESLNNKVVRMADLSYNFIDTKQ